MTMPLQRHRLPVYLSADLLERLRRLADEEDRSMAAVVRRAVEDRIERQETAA